MAKRWTQSDVAHLLVRTVSPAGRVSSKEGITTAVISKPTKRMNLVVQCMEEYVSTYSAQEGYETYSDKTFLDDMLYGIGLALAIGTPTDHCGPGGYERFKERLRQHLSRSE